MKRLSKKIKSDLHQLNNNTDFDIELRGYSKTVWGIYHPDRKLIVLYPFICPSKEFMRSYDDLFLTALHEYVHHLQYSNPSFTRYHGVMHDAEFWKLYDQYSKIYLGGKHENSRTRNAITVD